MDDALVRSKNLVQSLLTLQGQHEETNTALQRLKDDNEASKNVITEVHQATLKRRAEMEAVKAAHAETMKKKLELSKNGEDLDAMAALKVESENLDKRSADAAKARNDQSRQLKSELDSTLEANALLGEQIKQGKSSLNSALEAQNAYLTEYTKLAASLEKTKADLDTSQTSQRALEEELAKIKGDFEQDGDMQKSIEADLEKNTADLAISQKHLLNVLDTHDELLQELAQQFAVLKSYRAELAPLEEELAKAKKDLASTTEELQEMKETLCESTRKCEATIADCTKNNRLLGAFQCLAEEMQEKVTPPSSRISSPRHAAASH